MKPDPNRDSVYLGLTFSLLDSYELDWTGTCCERHEEEEHVKTHHCKAEELCQLTAGQVSQLSPLNSTYFPHPFIFNVRGNILPNCLIAAVRWRRGIVPLTELKTFFSRGEQLQ